MEKFVNVLESAPDEVSLMMLLPPVLATQRFPEGSMVSP